MAKQGRSGIRKDARRHPGAKSSQGSIEKGKASPAPSRLPERGIQIPGRLRATLGPLYARIPSLPLLGRSGTAILLATAILYVLFTAAVFLTLPKPEMSVGIFEPPLAKNAQLSIYPGETYAYAISSPQGNYTAYYAVSSSPSCAGAVVEERATGFSSKVCILPSGNTAEPGFESMNSGLGNSSMLLFSPWMLAASENFSWLVNTTVSASGVQISSLTLFSSSGAKRFAGRDAYEITVVSDGQEQARFAVDSEKRVALQIEAGGATAKLVAAPFALDWGNSSSQN